MARLPIPGSDDSTWGDILNEFLNQAHNSDGTLKVNAVATATVQDAAITAPKIANGAVGASQLADAAITTSKVADGSITTAKLADAQSLLTSNGLRSLLIFYAPRTL